MSLEIAIPVTVKQPANIWVSGQENSSNVLSLRDLSSRPCATHSDPNWRMGLLIRPRPYIDLTGMEPTPLKIERTLMVSPGFHD